MAETMLDGQYTSLLEAEFHKQISSVPFKHLVLNERKESETIFNDTHREKPTSNKTPTLTKSMNMGLWQVVNSYQLSIRN